MKKLINFIELAFFFVLLAVTAICFALSYIMYRMPHFSLIHNMITGSIAAISCAVVAYAAWNLLLIVDKKFKGA